MENYVAAYAHIYNNMCKVRNYRIIYNRKILEISQVLFIYYANKKRIREISMN